MSRWLKSLIRLHAEGKISEERLSVWLAWYLSVHVPRNL